MITAAEDFGAPARDHLDHPRNVGPFPDNEAGEISSGEAGSSASGSFVRFHLRVAAGRIEAVRYEVLGKPALIAASSCLSELLVGGPAIPGAVPPGLEIARALGLPRAEHGAALLAEDAALAALR
ncbi:MAG: iron-sulfur cluster assembly scaffold protein [Gammaproteobacteria bacterium]